jgi:hypothetical protein
VDSLGACGVDAKPAYVFEPIEQREQIGRCRRFRIAAQPGEPILPATLRPAPENTANDRARGDRQLECFCFWRAALGCPDAGTWSRLLVRLPPPGAGGEIQAEGVGVVVGGMLSLLAFVLALTLTFANSRFSDRVEGTLAEANAIGTAWLRAEAIGHVRGPEIAKLLEEYTRLRREYVSEGRDQSAIDELNQRTNALQSKIWGHVAAIVREQPNPVSTSLMAALNDAFDQATAERFAYNLRLPTPIFWLLLGMTLLGMAALGFQLGLTGKQVHVMVAFLSIMWTVVIVDILDLASPRIGAFRASAAVYDCTLQGFKGGLQIPPLPSAK